ncbi:MAG: 2-amino-4-hydroxy-6-hydroxymethyldihydropteridine diphosphokinase [Planctomicrobium sp.]|jgi:2-amino-4-hydroxy-6-hydroxymethyldihydropteridine diphosphokinase|nr:2-amino-4-hydroxy-6-hydroxymethyldihydropteridine diphosphokinase [Planctomicrobium sp.]
MSEQRTEELVLIALGSNISPETNLPDAVGLLSLEKHVKVLKASSVWESEPVGFLEQPPFCNAAVSITTTLSPDELKNKLLEIEQKLQRVRDPANKNGPRTIDLDISLFGSIIFSSTKLQIPDPEIQTRPFLAIPLAEVAENFKHPILDVKLSEIAEEFKENCVLQQRLDINLVQHVHKIID